MERVTIEVKIIDGRTKLVKTREELPLFESGVDLTATLGQYAGVIAPGERKSPPVKKEKEKPLPLYLPESANDGTMMW